MHSISLKLGVALAGLAITLLCLTPSSARSDEWNLKTIFTVSHQFAVPGKVLEPNTKYVMKLLDLSGTRNVVQIFNEDQNDLLTTFMAASDYRLEPEDTTVFEFIEVDAGYPKPIRSWFYPGRLNGLEFIYPKDQAMDIVRHSKEGVLTAEGEVDFHDLRTVQVAAIDFDDALASTAQTARATTQPAEMDVETDVDVDTDADVDMDIKTDTEVTREKPSASPDVDAVQTEETAPAAPQDDADMDDDSAIDEESEPALPETAGELPLLLLIGGLAIGAGLGLRVMLVRS